MEHVVFVYGTLKRGFPNHGLLSRARPLGAAWTRSPYPLAVAGPAFVPVLLRRPGAGLRVKGELYAVDGPTLRALDELEGVEHPRGYRRGSIDVVRDADREVVPALVYFKEEPPGELHTSWLEDYQDRRYREDVD